HSSSLASGFHFERGRYRLARRGFLCLHARSLQRFRSGGHRDPPHYLLSHVHCLHALPDSAFGGVAAVARMSFTNFDETTPGPGMTSTQKRLAYLASAFLLFALLRWSVNNVWDGWCTATAIIGGGGLLVW